MTDYIVVGGGTSGCVVAARLAEAGCRVVLIEAGQDFVPGGEPSAIRSAFPMATAVPDYFWPNLQARTGSAAAGREAGVAPWPQARVIGGGSSINGMISLRGLASDYDEWASLGARGWDWNSVLPHFRRLERDADFDGPLHGSSGPIPICRTPRNRWSPLTRAFSDALAARDFPLIDDFNGGRGCGIGAVPMAHFDGIRSSSASAYLTAAVRGLANLKIIARATVTELRFDGPRVKGVDIDTSEGKISVEAQETILCAGTVHSAALMMRSGIGPGEHLRTRGIAVIADRPGVGQNLQNHPGGYIPLHLPRRSRQPASELAWSQAAVRYSSGHANCADGDMILMCVNKAGLHPLGQRMAALSVSVFKSYSKGCVSLDEEKKPCVDFRMLSDPRDECRLVRGTMLLFSILSDARVRAVRNEVVMPDPGMIAKVSRPTVRAWATSAMLNAVLSGPAFLRKEFLSEITLDCERLANDEQVAHDFVSRHCGASGHAVGTCRMGASHDALAVVDPECRVIGVPGLRVADGSIMPAIVSANTNLPITMIAEKAAKHILSDRNRPSG